MMPFTKASLLMLAPIVILCHPQTDGHTPYINHVIAQTLNEWNAPPQGAA
jgi:hypothetical protein